VVARKSVALILRRARARAIIRGRRFRKAAGGRRLTCARRAVLAATLLAVALVPYPVIGSASVPSTSTSCHTNCQHTRTAGKILWARDLPGTWAVTTGLNGTVPAQGQSYAAVGHGLAVVGVGMSLRAYNSRTGQPAWSDDLPGFPAGSAIVSVRVWPGVVTAGVAYGNGNRAEIVFNRTTGQQYHWYSATRFGGAVYADAQTTVVVGPGAVTAYANSTGKARWRRPTGSADQTWQVDGSDLYVTVSADGYLGSQPVTALRRIDLATGLESLVRPAAASFPGTLSGVVDNVALFSSATGVTAYDGLTGLRLWSLAGAVLESTDPSQGRFYLTLDTSLLEVDPASGQVLARTPGSAVAGSAGLFAVRDGVALGLDQGANGEAWGYDVSTQQVIWTASGVPWPHYFVDLSGLGGSADAVGATVIVAACGQLAPKSARAPAPSASGSAAASSSAGTTPSSSATASTPTPSTPTATSPTAATSSTASPTPTSPTPTSTAPSVRLCQRPELVAIYR
jgi:hypothetical protein